MRGKLRQWTITSHEKLELTDEGKDVEKLEHDTDTEEKIEVEQ